MDSVLSLLEITPPGGARCTLLRIQAHPLAAAYSVHAFSGQMLHAAFDIRANARGENQLIADTVQHPRRDFQPLINEEPCAFRCWIMLWREPVSPARVRHQQIMAALTRR